MQCGQFVDLAASSIWPFSLLRQALGPPLSFFGRQLMLWEPAPHFPKDRTRCKIQLTRASSWRFTMSKKKRKKMRGTVQKIIKPVVPGEQEKAQISVEEGDDLYREIRVENVVTDENGEKARLKAGSDVDVVVEADSDATTKKPD